MPLLFLALAGFVLFVAIRTLVKKRPVVLSTRWFFALVCLAFLPGILNPFLISTPSSTVGMIVWIPPAMYSVLLAFFWIQMKGYVVFGISESYLRDTLLSATASLGYTVEERMSSLKIVETGHEMQVSVQGWVGTAQIKPRNRESVDSVKNVVKALDRGFATTPGKMNYITAYLYLVLGVFIILCAGSIFVTASKLRELPTVPATESDPAR